MRVGRHEKKRQSERTSGAGPESSEGKGPRSDVELG